MNKILFPKITLFLLLIIPLTFFGFNPTYFSKLSSTDILYHAHAGTMMLWVVLAIVQPFLIHSKKTNFHRIIGKASYFIMPLLFVTSYLIIRHTYYKFIASQTAEIEKGLLIISPEELSINAAAYIMIGVVYIIWLLIFYLLAVINRKKIIYHATYMFAAILTLLGPTIDRILYQITMFFGGSFNVFVENAVFVFILSILTALIFYQKSKSTNFKPALIALSIYVVGIAGYHLLPKVKLWSKFIQTVL